MEILDEAIKPIYQGFTHRTHDKECIPAEEYFFVAILEQFYLAPIFQ